MTRRSAIGWAVVVLLPTLCVGFHEGTEVVQEEIVVRIMPYEAKMPEVKPIDEEVAVLRRRLRDRGFDVECLSDISQTATQFLAENDNVHILIVGIIPRHEKGAWAEVYVQGTRSPRVFERESASVIPRLVQAYIETDEVKRTLANLRLEQKYGRQVPSDQDGQYEFYILKGVEHHQKSELQQAIKAFNRASEIRPDRPQAYFNLCLCYNDLGQPEEHNEYVEKTLACDANHLGALNEKAIIHLKGGKPDEAIKLLKDIAYDNPVTNWNLALAYADKRDYDRAKEYFSRVVEVDAGLAEQARDKVIELQALIEKRNQQIEAQKSELQSKNESLEAKTLAWRTAFAGLLLVGLIALVILIWRQVRPGDEGLARKDLLALRVQIAIAVLTGVFGLLSTVFERLF